MNMKIPLSPLAALLACSCAVFDVDNRRTLNWLDGHATPQSSGGRWALAPVALPVGIAAFAADACVVHPVCAVDDAWRDTHDFLWRHEQETELRSYAMAPLRAVATPVVFASDWLVRALFAVPPHEPEDAESQPEGKQ